MPINVIGNSSGNSENKIDTSSFVQKPYLRSNYIESAIEENIDLKNHFRINKLPDPISIREAASKNYVDNKINDASITKKTLHILTSMIKNLNVIFIKVNSAPAVPEHLTAKYYVHQAISNSVDEASLLGLDPNEKLKLDEQDLIILISTLTSPKTKIETPTKSYVDSLPENSRNRRDLSSVFIHQDNEFHNIELSNSDCITVNRNLSLDNEVSKMLMTQ